MRNFLLAACALALGAVVMMDSAEAARLGGGRSFGAQRIAPMQRQAQPARPPQQSSAKPAQPAPTAPAPAGRSFGPIAGLAAGLGLGWLIGHGGLGGVLGSLLLMLVLAFAATSLMRLLANRNAEMTRRAHLSAFGAGSGAELGNETVAAPPPSQIPSAEADSQPDFRSQFQAKIPPGFDADGFVKQAKLNFVRLQEANDRGNIDALRELTTEGMFAVLKLDVLERAGRPQRTDVVSLSASLLEVVTEGQSHWASVHFVGSLRDSLNADLVDFEEIWNMQKPVDGKTGWLLAGIQQPALA